MKRLICSLLILNLISVKVNGDQYNSDGSYTINLYTQKTPSYTVKIPRTLDVSEEITTLTFYVKGDIYADQLLKVDFDDTAIISNSIKTVELQIVQTKDSWSYYELSDSYQGFGVIISHTKLNAGTWSGHLNVEVSLQGGSNQ